MLPLDYNGYIGWFTTTGGCKSDAMPLCGKDALTDKAMVNAFIAAHLNDERVVIACGSSETAHTLIIVECGRTVHGVYHDGIGTPEVLLAQQLDEEGDSTLYGDLRLDDDSIWCMTREGW